MGSTEILLLLGLFVLVAFYGVWRHTSAETNSFNQFVERANHLTKEINTLQETLVELEREIMQDKAARTANNIKFDALTSSVDEMAGKVNAKPKLVRLSFDQSSPLPVQVIERKKIVASTIKPKIEVPTPIFPLTKKQIEKIKKQVRKLSK